MAAQENGQEQQLALDKDFLASSLFSILFERIISNALEEHRGKVSIGDRTISNLRFADDIDALAEEKQKLEALVESVDKTCRRYKMAIRGENNKRMTNNANDIQKEIEDKVQKLGTVTVLFQMKAQNWGFSRGLHKLLQL